MKTPISTMFSLSLRSLLTLLQQGSEQRTEENTTTATIPVSRFQSSSFRQPIVTVTTEKKMPENPVGEIFEGIMETIADHMPKQKSVRFLEEENPVSQQINKLFGRQEENPVSQQINKLFGRQEENPVSAQMNKLFGRQQSIHNVFGGGKPADVLLWRNKKVSSSVLVGATAIWVLFEWLNYHFLTLACFALVAGMVIRFLWTHASGLMNSSPSSVPRIVLPQELFVKIGTSVGADVNRFLCFLQDVASGRDLKQFVMVVAGLWAAAIIGSWCNFLTVLYIGFMAAHTLPVFYEKYEDQVDGCIYNLLGHLQQQYKKLDEGVLSKIPKGNLKSKKSE